MRDFKFNFDTLNEFSNSNPYQTIPPELRNLFSKLDENKLNLNFPAIHNDVGSFIQFMMASWKPKTVFEMGSGYGHSAFWFLLGGQQNIQRIHLTERRSDLVEYYQDLPWPSNWLPKIEYHQADAFETLDQVTQDGTPIDLALIDGVKADYLKFLESLETKMTSGGIVLIDNSYWRGSFLDKDLLIKKESARKIKELHDFIAETEKWQGLFIPYLDGLSILRFR